MDPDGAFIWSLTLLPAHCWPSLGLHPAGPWAAGGWAGGRGARPLRASCPRARRPPPSGAFRHFVHQAQCRADSDAGEGTPLTGLSLALSLGSTAWENALHNPQESKSFSLLGAMPCLSVRFPVTGGVQITRRGEETGAWKPAFLRAERATL